MKTPAEINEHLLALEAQHGLFDLEVDGVELWAVMRLRVQRELLRLVTEQKGLPTPLNRRLSTQLKTLPWRDPGMLWGRTHLPTVSQPDLLLVAHPRLIERDGEFVCRYSGPLVEGSAWRVVTLLATNHGRRYPTRDGSVYWPELDLARAALRARPRRLARFLRRGWPLLQDAVALIEGALGVRVPPARLRRHAALVAGVDLVYAPFAERLLDRLAPRVVVEVVHYGDLNFVLNRLCAERGIPVLELQHGVLGPAHFAYRARSGRRRCWPSAFLSYGDFWVEHTPDFFLPRSHTPAVGFALLEEARGRLPRRPSARPNVLFLSQWILGSGLSRLALDVARRLGPEGWTVRFRLHPSERGDWRQRYPELVGSAVEIVDGDHPVYEDQAIAHAQVGVHSTSVLEGLAWGVPTFIAALDGSEEMCWLIDGGGASLVASGQELADRLRAVPVAPDTKLAERMWAADARARFRQAVDDAVAGAFC